MFWFIGYLIGIYLFAVVDVILSFIVGKSLGMSLMLFTFFGNEGRRIYTKEKLRWTKGNFSIIPTAYFGKRGITKSDDIYYLVIK